MSENYNFVSLVDSHSANEGDQTQSDNALYEVSAEPESWKCIGSVRNGGWVKTTVFVLVKLEKV